MWSLWYFLFVAFLAFFIGKWTRMGSKIRLNQGSRIALYGGCMGIGLQIGKQLCRQYKPQLTILDVRTDLFASTQKVFIELGCKSVEFRQCDLSDIQQTKKALLEQELDFVIYNAGITNIAFSDVSNFDKDQKVLTVNLLSPIMIGQHYLKQFIKHGHGDIMFVGSVTSQLYGPRMASYIASKHGLQGFVKSLRVEAKMLAPNSKICTVLPWVVSTGLFTGFYTPVMMLVPQLTPEQVGIRTVEAIKYGDVEVVIPYKLGLMMSVSELLPRWVLDWISIQTLGKHAEDLVGRTKHE